jgi:hypothetical protein
MRFRLLYLIGELHTGGDRSDNCIISFRRWTESATNQSVQCGHIVRRACPNTIMEAFAGGPPVVSNTCGGSTELTEQGYHRLSGSMRSLYGEPRLAAAQSCAVAMHGPGRSLEDDHKFGVEAMVTRWT